MSVRVAGWYELEQWDRERREDRAAVYEKPPAIRSDQAEYHTAPEWHVCVACRESWLCREHHAHGHPGCPGTPIVLPPPRKPWPADWRRAAGGGRRAADDA